MLARNVDFATSFNVDNLSIQSVSYINMHKYAKKPDIVETIDQQANRWKLMLDEEHMTMVRIALELTLKPRPPRAQAARSCRH